MNAKGRRTSVPNRTESTQEQGENPEREEHKDRGDVEADSKCRCAKEVKKLIKLEASLTIKVDVPGQARKIGSSIGMERAMSTANGDSHAGRVDEGD